MVVRFFMEHLVLATGWSKMFLRSKVLPVFLLHTE
jgi:hypothetical protein